MTLFNTDCSSGSGWRSLYLQLFLTGILFFYSPHPGWQRSVFRAHCQVTWKTLSELFVLVVLWLLCLWCDDCGDVICMIARLVFLICLFVHAAAWIRVDVGCFFCFRCVFFECTSTWIGADDWGEALRLALGRLLCESGSWPHICQSKVSGIIRLR